MDIVENSHGIAICGKFHSCVYADGCMKLAHSLVTNQVLMIASRYCENNLPTVLLPECHDVAHKEFGKDGYKESCHYLITIMYIHLTLNVMR